MKKLYLFLLVGALYAQTMSGCPTCIGRLELQSPAFFSDELYELSPEDDVKISSKTSEPSEKKSSQESEDDDD